MRYLSLFSGIEAASVAWRPLGWHCVAVAEIEPFPCSVLAHHYPDTPNLGDVTKVVEATIAALGPVDLVVFGSPCQDLSVAGKRKGFEDGTRSSLFFTAIDIVRWVREHCGARFALWENVPGAFSSNEGRDFAAVVGSLAGLDHIDVPAHGWGSEGCALGDAGLVEWGTLDAQWFGVAQRRRRVFALADFGDWASRAPVLLEPDSLRGNSAPSRQAGQTVAGTLDARAAGGGFPGSDGACNGHVVASTGNVAHCLNAGGTRRIDYESETLLAFDTTQCTSAANRSNPQPGDPSHPLAAGMHAPAIAFNSREDCVSSDQVFGSLGASSPQSQAVAFQSSQSGVRIDNVHATLDSNNGSRRHNGAVMGSAVRRLTPTECERLQGFPDDYTLVPHRGKPAADGPRYRALGNSMAVPVMRHIGEQIADQSQKPDMPQTQLRAAA